MCVVLSSTGSEFHSVGPETAKLRGTVRVRGLQDFHARPIVDAGIHCRLMRSSQQGMKEQHHVGTWKQEHQIDAPNKKSNGMRLVKWTRAVVQSVRYNIIYTDGSHSKLLEPPIPSNIKVHVEITCSSVLVVSIARQCKMLIILKSHNAIDCKGNK